MLERIECPARVAYGQHAIARGREQGQAALLGDLVHRAMEIVVVGHEEPAGAWTSAVSEFVEKGFAIGEIAGIGRIRARFRRGAAAVRELLAAMPATSEPAAEVELFSECRTVRGTPDLVWFAEEGMVVIDYKSGVVSNEAGTKPGYVRQLQIYSALASSHYDRPVAKAVLFSFKQGTVEVSVDEASMLDAMAGARMMRESFNRRVPGEQPTVATESNCMWCHYQPQCDGFWNALDTGDVGRAGMEARRGTVARPVEHSQGGSGVTLQLDGHSDQTALIARVPASILEGVVLGDRVAFSSLRRRGEDDEQKFEWSSGRSRAFAEAAT